MRPTVSPHPKRSRTWIPWLACAALAVIGVIGWLRPAERGGGEDADEDTSVSADDLDAVREQVAAAGFAQRVRIVNRLGRLGALGNAGATQSLIDVLREAQTERVRVATIKALGRLGTPDAVRELEALVSTGGRQLQHHAIRALGAAGTVGAVDALERLLDRGTPARTNRDEVVDALGAAGGQRALAILTRLAKDPAEREREDAVKALGATGSADALSTLEALLSDDIEAIRKAAVGALGEIGTPRARKTLERLIAGGSPPMREEAVEALGAFSDEAALARLAALVNDRDPAVAKAALLELARKQGATVTGALHAALKHHSSDVRTEAAEALAHSGDPAGIRALAGQLHTERYPHWIATQLARSSDPAAHKALFAAASAGTGSAAVAAVTALGSLRGVQAERALQQAMRSGSSDVATEALEQLTARKGKAALPMLLATLKSGSNELRGKALAAVAELGDPRARKVLLDAARHAEYGSARAAVEGLVKIGGSEVTRTLLSLSKNGSSYTRGYAIDALARLGGPEARDVLLKGLSSKDYQISYASRSGLAQLRGPEVSRRLNQMLSDPKVDAETKGRVVEIWAERQDRPALLRAAQHADQKVAAEALEALGKSGGDEAERLLAGVATTSAQPPARRTAAVKALGQLGTPGAVRSLNQALHEPKLLGQASEALAEIGSREAMSALRDRYLGADTEQRLTIIGKLGDDPNPWGRDLLTQALQSGDARLSAAAGRSWPGARVRTATRR